MQPVEDPNVRRSAESLERMMALASDSSPLWSVEELGEILQHQLAAPLEFDLLGVRPELVAELHAKWAVDPPIATFGDLFQHPAPPVEFLEMAKQYAKASRARSDGPLTEEVAVVLHLLSIAAALVRCDKPITRLDDQGLLFGLDGALGQPWLVDFPRELLQAAREKLRPRRETGGERGP